ncbi:MAG: hypothetical protein CSA82_00255 [Actinobacteria bacterium]|nr:MAG: hypothetical protein CSA82_00255 [Actinomycetota bacterium]
MTGIDTATVLGWGGAAFSMAAYWSVSTGRMTGDSLRYQALNIAACTLLAYACFATHSWPSMVTNSLFILIGLHMTWRVRHRLYARIHSQAHSVNSAMRRYILRA